MLEHPPVLARHVELVVDQAIECVSHLGQTRVHRQFASPNYVAFQEHLFILSLAPFSLQARLTMNCFPVILTYKITKDTRSTRRITSCSKIRGIHPRGLQVDRGTVPDNTIHNHTVYQSLRQHARREFCAWISQIGSNLSKSSHPSIAETRWFARIQHAYL